MREVVIDIVMARPVPLATVTRGFQHTNRETLGGLKEASISISPTT